MNKIYGYYVIKMGGNLSRIEVGPDIIKKDTSSSTIRPGVQQSQDQEIHSRNVYENNLFQQQYLYAKRIPTQTIKYR